jgi:hypothetical protein
MVVGVIFIVGIYGLIMIWPSDHGPQELQLPATGAQKLSALTVLGFALEYKVWQGAILCILSLPPLTVRNG